MSYFYQPNRGLEEKVNDFFRRVADYCDYNFCGCLSVILVGSLSRGEATWIQNPDGSDRLLSDIEFFTVYPRDFRAFKEYSDMLSQIAQDIFRGQDSSLFYIDNTFIPEKRMPTIGRKLIIYDTQCFGKCVVGKDVKDLFPKIDIRNIVMDDIGDVMSHRIFSVLYYGIPMKESGDIEGYRYSLAKNSLDLMTVILVNQGVLESGFINRLKRIKSLPISDQFKDYFEYCLSIKLHTPIDRTYSVEQMEMLFLKILKETRKDFRVSVSNRIVNISYLLRTRLGIWRRAILQRHFPVSKKRHLSNMIDAFERWGKLTSAEKKHNRVIFGYPH